MDWYNNDHKNSGIKFVTPAQRHNGKDKAIMEKRTMVYEKARSQHPKRGSGDVRDWEMTETVYLNPEKECA